MTLSNEDRKKRDDAIAKLVKDIESYKFDASEVLDDYVHEAKAEEAAAINNEGTQAQIKFLVDSWGPEETEKAIREALGIEKPKEETPNAS